MINITDDTALVGSTDLRKDMPKLTKELQIKTIIVMKKGKPFAVLESFDRFEEKERTIDAFEDLVLGHLAKEREEKSKKGDYVPEKKVVKKFGVSF